MLAFALSDSRDGGFARRAEVLHAKAGQAFRAACRRVRETDELILALSASHRRFGPISGRGGGLHQLARALAGGIISRGGDGEQSGEDSGGEGEAE